VMDDHHAVSRRVDIQFDALGPLLERDIEPLQCIFEGLAGCAAVGDDLGEQVHAILELGRGD